VTESLSPSNENFESILEAAKAGAEWAWASLFRELSGPVTGYLASRGAAEPEDVSSEVFFNVARGIHSFEGDRASFRSWVFVITHRKLIDERRLRARRPRIAVFPEDTPTGSEGGNVENEALTNLITGELRVAFEQLTEAQRDVLALRLIAGLTLAETAQVVGKRVGAIKALQRRALETLHKTLDFDNVTL
jgi:RNA polymerase sigma factor (sigma-70 family)